MKPVIMVMGIMASGKSRIGYEIADRLGFAFIEGDDYHPTSNVEKMRAGQPLTDEDRAPWLLHLAGEVRGVAETNTGVVFSCSALKRHYREALKAVLPDMLTVCLELDAETAVTRSSGRDNHFMPTALVDSQLATLELPVDEPQTLIIDACGPFEQVLSAARRVVDDWLAEPS